MFVKVDTEPLGAVPSREALRQRLRNAIPTARRTPLTALVNRLRGERASAVRESALKQIPYPVMPGNTPLLQAVVNRQKAQKLGVVAKDTVGHQVSELAKARNNARIAQKQAKGGNRLEARRHAVVAVTQLRRARVLGQEVVQARAAMLRRTIGASAAQRAAALANKGDLHRARAVQIAAAKAESRRERALVPAALRIPSFPERKIGGGVLNEFEPYFDGHEYVVSGLSGLPGTPEASDYVVSGFVNDVDRAAAGISRATRGSFLSGLGGPGMGIYAATTGTTTRAPSSGAGGQILQSVANAAPGILDTLLGKIGLTPKPAKPQVIVQQVQAPPEDDDIFGLPRKAVLVGGGVVLAVGLASALGIGFSLGGRRRR